MKERNEYKEKGMNERKTNRTKLNNSSDISYILSMFYFSIAQIQILVL